MKEELLILCTTARVVFATSGSLIHTAPDVGRQSNGEAMKSTYLFPIAMIVMDVGAAVVYAVNKEYKKAVYWIAAAVLNVCVTF